MYNPYSEVNWQSNLRVNSCSHEHCESQQQMNILSANGVLKHYAISNYYPSTPCYPVQNYYTVPSGVISSPNAEQHNFKLNGEVLYDLHINSLGSFFSAGSPRGETPVGCDRADVKKTIKDILDELQYPDAGGITINHPTWSRLKTKQVIEMLDTDSRVLGIEIFNTAFVETRSGVDIGAGMEANLRMWDEILTTGRRCFGFCVADHQGQGDVDWKGYNVLLVDELTEYKCLKAYRDGNFYSRIIDSDLDFVSVGLNGRTYSVETVNADYIKVIINGVSQIFEGNSCSVEIPPQAVYVRAEGHLGEGENRDVVFSNPIFIKGKKKRRSFANRILFYD